MHSSESTLDWRIKCGWNFRGFSFYFRSSFSHSYANDFFLLLMTAWNIVTKSSFVALRNESFPTLNLYPFFFYIQTYIYYRSWMNAWNTTSCYLIALVGFYLYLINYLTVVCSRNRATPVTVSQRDLKVA